MPDNKLTLDEFNRLYAENKFRFTVIANSFLQDWELAEDTVSESFVHFWENRGAIEIGTHPQAYVLGIVRNKSLMALRRRQCQVRLYDRIRSSLLEEAISELEDDKLIHQLFNEEISDIFRKQLEEMPELMSKIFIANRLRNQTYQEIAQQYDISVHKVAREMQKALAILRVSLKDYLPILISILYL